MPTIHEQKLAIRNYVKKIRLSLDKKDSELMSELICNNLSSTSEFIAARCIALYYSTNDEVQTHSFIEHWFKYKKIALPVINGCNLSFHLYVGQNSLIKNAYGIMEPIDNKKINLSDIDLFIVPGVAFDRSCKRLGRGKGYYDRLLATTNKPIFGLCYEFQIVNPYIPTESHDIKMNKIITEKCIYSAL